jgi:hypothetical protein
MPRGWGCCAARTPRAHCLAVSIAERPPVAQSRTPTGALDALRHSPREGRWLGLFCLHEDLPSERLTPVPAVTAEPLIKSRRLRIAAHRPRYGSFPPSVAGMVVPGEKGVLAAARTRLRPTTQTKEGALYRIVLRVTVAAGPCRHPAGGWPGTLPTDLQAPTWSGPSPHGPTGSWRPAVRQTRPIRAFSPPRKNAGSTRRSGATAFGSPRPWRPS